LVFIDLSQVTFYDIFCGYRFSLTATNPRDKKFKVQKQTFVNVQDQGWIPYTGQDKIILHDFSRHRHFSGEDKFKQDPL
jgi:hypothetical protein